MPPRLLNLGISRACFVLLASAHLRPLVLSLMGDQIGGSAPPLL